MIAISILAQIATFTIPKLLASQQANQRDAIIKQTYGTISSLMYQGKIQQTLTPSTLYNSFIGNMNAVKYCPTNSVTEGCWDPATQGTSLSERTQPGAILHNGATLVGFDNCCNPGAGVYHNNVFIDYNGTSGPNLMNQDQYQISVCFGTASCGTQRAGTVDVVNYTW
jgi:hypothetical protein